MCSLRHLSSRTVLLTISAILLNDGIGRAQVTYEVLYSFKGGTDGAAPRGGVVVGKSGALYGTTQFGGANTCSNGSNYLCGTVFVLAPGSQTPWTKTVIHSFNGNDGAIPGATLTPSTNGSLFGTTEVGGPGSDGSTEGGGTIFEMIPPTGSGQPWTETTLYSFPYNYTAPNTIYSGVTLGPNGKIFGTTFSSESGDGGRATGSVFELSPSSGAGEWSEVTLVNFSKTTAGIQPYGTMIWQKGTLIGPNFETSAGFLACGTIYQVTPPASSGDPWTAAAIYTFGSAPDGCNSQAPLIAGLGGVLYGTTYVGGTGAPCNFPPNLVSGCGTVFQLTPPATTGGAWSETALYSFTGTNGDGAYPYAGLVLGTTGVLYGTTSYGGSATTDSSCTSNGASGCGTIFSLTPPSTSGGAWTETILHTFTGENGDGAIPLAGLALSSTGVLYGTTSAGGGANVGTVFAIKP